MSEKAQNTAFYFAAANMLRKQENSATIVFDKTGTLTKGEPTVTDIKTYNCYTEQDVLMFAGSAEKGSEHPLAEAILKEAKKRRHSD